MTEKVYNLEERFEELKQSIIAALKTKGGDFLQRLKQMGHEMIRIASDEDEGGWSALILHLDGTWSLKFAMEAMPLGDISLVEVLQEYACLKDRQFQEMQCAMVMEREQQYEQGASTEEGDKLREKQSRRLRQYVEENRDRLLKELIVCMEGTLVRLQI